MNLRKVILQNVRHFSNKSFEFEGNSELIMPNEGGKSTLADAMTFLLIGKLYNGSSDIASLKPVKDTTLEVSVEALIVTSDNKEIVIKKVYKENWVKTRGQSTQEMKGHITTCYLNEEKMTISNYESNLCGYFNVNSVLELNIMLNPYFFSQNMDWKDRLVYIKKITGEVTPQDVLDLQPSLNEISEDLLKYPVAAIKRKYMDDVKDKKTRVNELNIQIKGFDITEEVSKADFDKAKLEIDSNTNQITNLKVKKAGIKNPVLENLKDQKQQKQEQINESVKADLLELQKKNQNLVDANNDLRDKKESKVSILNDISKEIHDINSKISNNKDEIKKLNNLLPLKRAKLDAKADEWHQENKNTFIPKESFICPNCGYDTSEEVNRLSEAEFKKIKANNLKSINAAGEELKAEIEKMEEKIKTLNADVLSLNDYLDKKNLEQNKIVAENFDITTKINKNNALKIQDFTSEETMKLREELDSIKASIELEETKPIDTEDIAGQITDLKAKNVELQQTVDKYNANQELKTRKAKLEDELIIKTDLLSDAENRVDLLNVYKSTYLSILTQRLDLHFPGIKFKLIEENIKADSWNEVCYIMVDTEYGLVPYETANTANKIKIGVKLSSLLAEALGWNKAPIMIDNCEAITEKNREFETEAQVITLVAADKQPRAYAENPKQETLELTN